MNSRTISKGRILLVDDEKDFSNTLRDILKLHGYNTTTLYSGLEALYEVKKNTFSCVIVDIRMPKMDGIELCRAIKKIQPDLPVVLITGYKPGELTEDAKNAGANAVLSKPFDIESFLEFLSDFCKK